MLVFRFSWSIKTLFIKTILFGTLLRYDNAALADMKESCALLREAWLCFLTVCLREKLHFCPFLSILKGCVTACTTHFQRLSGKKEQQVFSSWLWLCAYAISIPIESSGNSQISKVMLWGIRISGREGSLLNLEINLWRSRSGLTLFYHSYITRGGLSGVFLCHFHVDEWNAIHTCTSKPRCPSCGS